MATTLRSPYLALLFLLAEQLFPHHLKLSYHLGQSPFFFQERLSGQRLVQDRSAVHHCAVDGSVGRRSVRTVIAGAVDQRMP